MLPRSGRACFIYAALVCLCVSDGVGPRLLPYPDAPADEWARRALAASAARDGAPQVSSPVLPPQRLQAGDSLKKIPVFSAPDSYFGEAAPARVFVADSAAPSPRTAPAAHRLGRAPPAARA